MAPTTLHLRSETKPLEERSFLTPTTARKLLDAGYNVHVERSATRCFSDSEFAAVGATLVPEGSWPMAPPDHIIVGLKELPEQKFPLNHTHVFFAHVFKGQPGWQTVLDRFRGGTGTLLDIEFLGDGQGRLLAPSSFHAGYVGAALAVKAWARQLLYPEKGALPAVESYADDAALVRDVRESAAAGAEVAGRGPRAVVVGAGGRCGRGAVALLLEAGLAERQILRWGRKDTAAPGPRFDILHSDILVNCLYLDEAMAPLVDFESLGLPGRRLSVVSDVSCDCGSEMNPIPIYGEHTSFREPSRMVRLPTGPALSVISIDHLPSLLPREASEACSQALLPSVLELDDWERSKAWRKALDLFHEKLAEV